MEAAAIARLAAMRGIPFYCIKGVSDGLTDRLPDFNRFLSPDGQFQLARFTLFAILRPWYWPALVRMGENSKRASQSIAESLLDFLSMNEVTSENRMATQISNSQTADRRRDPRHHARRGLSRHQRHAP